MVASNTIYPTIKKHLETRQILQEHHRISLFKNDINAKNLVEVGFFQHKLVRHDAVECKKWLSDLCTATTPPFQQEIVTICGGPNNKRQGTGVLKVFTD
jgi:predicted metal-binding protein